jgi:hypothetical protein
MVVVPVHQIKHPSPIQIVSATSAVPSLSFADIMLTTKFAATAPVADPIVDSEMSTLPVEAEGDVQVETPFSTDVMATDRIVPPVEDSFIVTAVAPIQNLPEPEVKNSELPAKHVAQAIREGGEVDIYIDSEPKIEGYITTDAGRNLNTSKNPASLAGVAKNNSKISEPTTTIPPDDTVNLKEIIPPARPLPELAAQGVVLLPYQRDTQTNAFIGKIASTVEGMPLQRTSQANAKISHGEAGPVLTAVYPVLSAKHDVSAPIEKPPIRLGAEFDLLHQNAAPIQNTANFAPDEAPKYQGNIFHRAETPKLIQSQLIATVRGMDDQTIEVSLSPEELGRVRMTISRSDTGMTVTILAERPETLELMRRHAAQLHTEFRSLGHESTSFTFHQSAHREQPPPEAHAGTTQNVLVQDTTNQAKSTNLTHGPQAGLDLRL